MKKYSKIFCLLIVAILLLTACSSKTAASTVVPTTIQPDVLIAQGRLIPGNSLDQSFPIPGQVTEVLVKDGDIVKVGQVLARLNNSPDALVALARTQQEALAAQLALDSLKTSAELNLAQAKLAVATAQKQHDTAQENYNTNRTDENNALLGTAAATLKMAKDTLVKLEAGKGVDADALAAAEARLTTANAAAVSAQSALDALELKASMDGTIVDLSLQVGQRVTAGQLVITIADLSNWVVKTDNLTEVEVINVKIGQKVVIILDALPDVKLNGEVTHINTRFEEKRGDITYTVTVALSQTDARMRWGMTSAVQFVP
jgi:multidrug resistance efflux pump